MAPALTTSPSRTGSGTGLAGQDGVVERRAAREDDAVDGDELAGADLDAVAGGEGGERDLDGRGVGTVPLEPPGELEERDAAQAVGTLEGRPLGAPLDLPGAEEGRDEHRERVEPERAASAHGVPRARGEGDGEGDGDGEVDVDDPRPGGRASAVRKNGRAEKRRTGTETARENQRKKVSYAEAIPEYSPA